MRGVVTFTFDDGYAEVFKNVPPLLERYNFPGIFAVAINHNKIEKSENRSCTPWQEWLALKTRGHEIAAHSVNHTNITKLSDHELERELREPVEKLDTKTLVYPGGAYDDRVIRQARKFYAAARTVRRGLETLPPRDRMRLASYNWTKHNFSPGKANLLALWAYVTGSWLIETFHMVSDTDVVLAHSVKADGLDKHLSFVAKLPIHVRTISQVIGDYHN